jgi:hypothetical protein
VGVVMSKDVYKVIHNPNNYIFHYEVWVKGEREEYLGAGRSNTYEVAKCISSWRTEKKAREVAKYWEDLQAFKMGLQEDSCQDNVIKFPELINV